MSTEAHLQETPTHHQYKFSEADRIFMVGTLTGLASGHGLDMTIVSVLRLAALGLAHGDEELMAVVGERLGLDEQLRRAVARTWGAEEDVAVDSVGPYVFDEVDRRRTVDLLIDMHRITGSADPFLSSVFRRAAIGLALPSEHTRETLLRSVCTDDEMLARLAASKDRETMSRVFGCMRDVPPQECPSDIPGAQTH